MALEIATDVAAGTLHLHPSHSNSPPHTPGPLDGTKGSTPTVAPSPTASRQDGDVEQGRSSGEGKSDLKGAPQLQKNRLWNQVVLIALLFCKILLFGLPAQYRSRLAHLSHRASSLEELLKKDPENLRHLVRCRSYETLPVDFWDRTAVQRKEKLDKAWQKFTGSVLREWKYCNILFALMISAIFSMLQIDSAKGDIVVRAAAFISLFISVIGIMFSTTLSLYFSKMQTFNNRALRWTKVVVPEENDEEYPNVWVVLSLPIVSLGWSLILFVTSVMTFSYIETQKWIEFILYVCVFSLGVLLLLWVLYELRSYETSSVDLGPTKDDDEEDVDELPPLRRVLQSPKSFRTGLSENAETLAARRAVLRNERYWKRHVSENPLVGRPNPPRFHYRNPLVSQTTNAGSNENIVLDATFYPEQDTDDTDMPPTVLGKLARQYAGRRSEPLPGPRPMLPSNATVKSILRSNPQTHPAEVSKQNDDTQTQNPDGNKGQLLEMFMGVTTTSRRVHKKSFVNEDGQARDLEQAILCTTPTVVNTPFYSDLSENSKTSVRKQKLDKAWQSVTSSLLKEYKFCIIAFTLMVGSMNFFVISIIAFTYTTSQDKLEFKFTVVVTSCGLCALVWVAYKLPGIKDIEDPPTKDSSGTSQLDVNCVVSLQNGGSNPIAETNSPLQSAIPNTLDGGYANRLGLQQQRQYPTGEASSQSSNEGFRDAVTKSTSFQRGEGTSNTPYIRKTALPALTIERAESYDAPEPLVGVKLNSTFGLPPIGPSKLLG
ncbi:hypothetical protein AX16_007189 [Volvariella volvacea WC 439]|nr:hypothetical protein AX16_007189 [Volvariella volvacea WC 439]